MASYADMATNADFDKLRLIIRDIIQKCHNEKNRSYHLYGLMGVAVCEQWRNDRESFCDWAFEAGWRPGLLVGRKNEDFDFSPENCMVVDRDKKPLDPANIPKDPTVAEMQLAHYEERQKANPRECWAKGIEAMRIIVAEDLESGFVYPTGRNGVEAWDLLDNREREVLARLYPPPPPRKIRVSAVMAAASMEMAGAKVGEADLVNEL